MSAHARDITLNVDAPYVDVRRFVDAGDARASTVVITIPLRASSRRLERALDEPIGKSFDRLRAGIAKSTKSAPKERLSVELFALDGSRVDDAATHVDAWNDDYALAVGDEWFRVRLDAPEIAGVTTVDWPVCGQPLPASVVGATFCLRDDDVAYVWSVIDDADGTERVVCTNRIYTPTSDVIGAKLVVDARPRGGEPRRFALSHRVRDIEAPRNDALNRLKPSTSRADVRVMTYNVLADAYSHTWSTMYPYFAPDLARAESRLQKVLEDVRVADADIVALQEVDKKWFELLYEPVLSARGYNATSWCGKSGQTQEGCAMFVKRAMFTIEDERAIRLTELDDAKILRWLDEDVNLELKTALKKITSIAQLVKLKSIVNGKEIVVGNTHLFFHPGAMHVRILQAHALTQKAREYGAGAPLILCGDFNGEPDDGVIRYLRSGEIRADDVDFVRGALFRWGGTSSRDRARDLFYVMDDGTGYDTVDRNLKVTDAQGLQNLVERSVCMSLCTRTLREKYGASCGCGIDALTEANPIIRVKKHVEKKCTFKNCHTVAAFTLRREAGLSPGTSMDDDDHAAALDAFRVIKSAEAAGFDAVRDAQTALTDAAMRDTQTSGSTVIPVGCGLSLTIPPESRIISAGGFLEWTNYVGGFIGALDYCWISQHAFIPRRVSPLPEMRAVLENTALPNAQFPSDHIPVVVDIDFVP